VICVVEREKAFLAARKSLSRVKKVHMLFARKNVLAFYLKQLQAFVGFLSGLGIRELD